MSTQRRGEDGVGDTGRDRTVFFLFSFFFSSALVVVVVVVVIVVLGAFAFLLLLLFHPCPALPCPGLALLPPYSLHRRRNKATTAIHCSSIHKQQQQYSDYLPSGTVCCRMVAGAVPRQREEEMHRSMRRTTRTEYSIINSRLRPDLRQANRQTDNRWVDLFFFSVVVTVRRHASDEVRFLFYLAAG